MLDIMLFVSGIALLLYAMQQLESALTRLGSSSFQEGLQGFTSTPLRGILFGLVSTAILQSSSIVGLMTMAFVGAGVIALRNAIGVILGSNLGTTLTGWIVTLIGFKLNLTDAAIPFLGIGAVCMVTFAKGSRGRHWGRFVYALGLLLFSLSVMKDSISFMIDYMDISALRDLPIIVFFLFGIVFTAIIQSSSATMIITLSAMHAGIIELPLAAALIVGADLGTTSTLILGSLSGTAVKKQVAMVHVFFNCVVAFTSIIFLPLLLLFVTRVLSISDPLIGLVALHSIINLFGIMLFFPFIALLEKKIVQWVRSDEPEKLTVDGVPSGVPDAALEALDRDIRQLLADVLFLNARRVGISLPGAPRLGMTQDDVYNRLKNRENLLTDYILDFSRQPLSLEQSARVQQYLVSIRDVLYAAKAVRDIEHDMDELVRQRSAVKHRLAEKFQGSMSTLYTGIMTTVAATAPAPEALAELQAVAEKAHADCNTELYELIDSKQLEKESASTLLNINREVLYSAHSLLNAVSNLLLPGKEARTVADLLNLKAT